MTASGGNTLRSGVWTCPTEDDTFALGASIGSRLAGGEILLLSGPLGAGKTIFAKGVASALDIPPDEVTSPSFTLVNPYRGRLRLFHLDLFRLNEGPGAAAAVDLDGLLAEDGAVVIIEWAERLGAYRLPEPAWHVSISGDGDDPRRVSIAHAIMT